mgnify:CR=1 FL=1
MNNRPIEQSGDADLRSLESALQRAALRARERARATGTRLALSRNGVLEFLPPERLGRSSLEVADRPGPYSNHE